MIKSFVNRLRGSGMKKRIFLSGILSTLLFFSPHHLHNSEVPQEKKDQQAFQYQVTVILKLVQVYVTDNRGNPVTDLAKDDFILFDNGKLQTITDFEKHILALPSQKIEERVEKEAKEEKKETEPSPTPVPPSMMNRKFLLLLDLFQTDASGMTRSKTAALHFVDTQLQPTDEVGVMTYTLNQGLVLNEYLTADHQKVRKAIQKIKSVPGRIYDPFEKDEELTEAEKVLKKTRALQFARDMVEFAKSLRYIPGFKNVILFSGGISRKMLYDTEAEEDAYGIPKTNPALREAYDELSKELASSNTPVYAVNTIGTRQLLEKGEGFDELGDHSLKMLSDLSGGQYFADVATYKAIAEKIQNVTGNYYVLGYYIDEKWDGKYHNIKVEVKRKGCDVHAQKGYFNPRPFAELSEFEKKFHLMDLALSGRSYLQEPLSFSLITLPCAEESESNLVLLSELPVETIATELSGKTEMITLVFNEENAVIDSSQGEVDFSVFSQKKLYHYSILSLSPGKYKCCVVIRDLKTGKGAVASSSVEILESQESGLRLYPPLLLIPDKEAHYLRAQKDTKEEAAAAKISLNKIYPFLTNRQAPVTGELEQGIPNLLAILRCSIFDIQSPEVDLTANLVNKATGQIMQLDFSILSSKSQEGSDILLIEFPLPEMKPGEYTLEISAEELSTQSKSKVTHNFRVK